MEKSELEPKQIFGFVGYVRPQIEQSQPTLECWQTLNLKIQEILDIPSCQFRQLVSLIGLLTDTEKQVYLGRFHMIPVQWHLKSYWNIPESLEKVIPIPHLKWCLEKANVLQSQPLHPLSHALQIFTDAPGRRLGPSLRRSHSKKDLVHARKQVAHKQSGNKGSLPVPKRVPRLLFKQDGDQS